MYNSRVLEVIYVINLTQHVSLEFPENVSLAPHYIYYELHRSRYVITKSKARFYLAQLGLR